MKNTLKAVFAAAQAAWFKLNIALLALMGLSASNVALAVTHDLRSDDSGGRNFGAIADNLDEAAQSGAGLIIQLVTVGGFVVVAASLYQLYKASKDERERPMSAIVGLFIGGAMAGVGTIMWIMKNTVVGEAA